MLPLLGSIPGEYANEAELNRRFKASIGIYDVSTQKRPENNFTGFSSTQKRPENNFTGFSYTWCAGKNSIEQFIHNIRIVLPFSYSE